MNPEPTYTSTFPLLEGGFFPNSPLVWPLPLAAQVLPCPQPIFPSKSWFLLEFIWIFSGKKSLKNQYLSHSESKSYQINSIKSCSLRSFQEHQKPIHSNSSEILSYDLISFHFQWKSHSIFKNFCTARSKCCHGTKAHACMHTSSSRAFPKTPRTWSQASLFSGSHNYKTKQNKTNYLPS